MPRTPSWPPSVSMLAAIVHGLTPDEKWNARFDPQPPDRRSSGWLNVLGVVLALLLGGTALMATIAFSAEHFFVWQIERAVSLDANLPSLRPTPR